MIIMKSLEVWNVINIDSYLLSALFVRVNYIFDTLVGSEFGVISRIHRPTTSKRTGINKWNGYGVFKLPETAILYPLLLPPQLMLRIRLIPLPTQNPIDFCKMKLLHCLVLEFVANLTSERAVHSYRPPIKFTSDFHEEECQHIHYQIRGLHFRPD